MVFFSFFFPQNMEGKKWENQIYLPSTNIAILPLYTHELNIDEQRRRGEDMRVDLRDGLRKGIFLLGGEWVAVLD